MSAWTGAIIGMHTFGASAPLAELQKKFGFTRRQGARGRPFAGQGVNRRWTFWTAVSPTTRPRWRRRSRRQPPSLVIFGGGGDLTKRLLMPALYNLPVAGLLADDFSVHGVDRVDQDDDAFRASQTETHAARSSPTAAASSPRTASTRPS